MDHTVARLENVEECEQYALNVAAEYPLLAVQARRRALEFRAQAHQPANDAEFASLQSLYACDQLLTRELGKRRTGTRLSALVKKNGVLPALEKLASDRTYAEMLTNLLAATGLSDLAYDEVIAKYPETFSPAAVKAMESRRAKQATRETANA